MSGRFVRASKYRHVHGEASKSTYRPVSAEVSGDSDHITASSIFFAYAGKGGGGPVVVRKIGDYERLPASPFNVNVHKAKVLDMEFSPFIPNLLATASDDCSASVTQVPADGLTAHVTKADANLLGHQKKVSSIHYHPVANNILGTASLDHTIKIWDIEKQAEVCNNEAPDAAQSFQWNLDGSLIAACYRDKSIAMYDPRSKEEPQHFPGLPGNKAARVVWLHNHGLLAVCGFNKNAQRVVGIWDPKDLSKQLGEVEIDSSAGAMMTYYDQDTSILYIAGKGDGNVRYFEVVNEPPYLYYLTEFRAGDSQKGITFLPKTAVDVHKCEIASCLRLMRDFVQPVSFQVPRKSDLFQEDIYPDTYAGIPMLSADEWLEGKNAEPKTRSMKPGTEVETVAADFKAQKSPAELQARIAQLEELLKANNIAVPADE